MSCQYKSECPSASGWCERDEIDYSYCIPFILSAYKRAAETAVLYECDRRACDRNCSPECHLTRDVRHARNFMLSSFADRAIFVERNSSDPPLSVPEAPGGL